MMLHSMNLIIDGSGEAHKRLWGIGVSHMALSGELLRIELLMIGHQLPKSSLHRSLDVSPYKKPVARRGRLFPCIITLQGSCELGKRRYLRDLMSDTLSEQELLKRLREGDKAACAMCIDMYGTQIYRLALRLMKNEADAEDVMQETFMNAYKSIAKFEGRSGLNTWLYRIAYNAAMMRLRRPSPYTLSIDETLQPETPTTIPQQLFDWCCLPERDFETAETRDYLEQSISELPEKLRLVFMLRELEELSTQETAEILDISTDAVKKRLHRARLWLRERLSRYFTEQALI